MKKIFALLIAVSLLFAGCNSTPAQDTADTPPSQPVEATQDQTQDTDNAEPDEEPDDMPSNPMDNIEVVSKDVYGYKDALNSSVVLYVAEIRNAGGTPLELGNISLALNDANGEIMSMANMPTLTPPAINPGESAFICGSVLPNGSDVDLNTVGDVEVNMSAKYTTETDLGIVISEISITEQYGRPTVVGRAENTSDKDYSMVMLSIPIWDVEGNLRTVAIGSIDSLNAGDTQPFSQMAAYVDINVDFTGATAAVIPYLLF